MSERKVTPEELAAWKVEFTTDPARLGYAGKTHEQIEDLLKDTAREAPNTTMTCTQLFEQIDADENLAVTDEVKRAVISDMLNLGTVNPAAVGFQKAIDSIFGPSSKTAKNINKYKKRQGRRWEELGLPRPSVSEIADALR